MTRARSCLVPLFVVLLSSGGCAWLDGGTVADRALLTRQVEQLRQLVHSAEQGPLFGPDQLVLVVDQRLIRTILAATLPWEIVVRERFRVRVHALECRFEDDLPLLRLDSHVAALGELGEQHFAELRLFAELTLTELDPQAGVVRGRLALIAFEVQRLQPVDDNAMAMRLVEELGRLKLEAFLALARSFDLPLRLERQLRFPRVGAEGSPVSLPAGRVTLAAETSRVRALGGRLWLALDATPGAWSPDDEATSAAKSP